MSFSKKLSIWIKLTSLMLDSSTLFGIASYFCFLLKVEAKAKILKEQP